MSKGYVGSSFTIFWHTDLLVEVVGVVKDDPKTYRNCIFEVKRIEPGKGPVGRPFQIDGIQLGCYCGSMCCYGWGCGENDPKEKSIYVDDLKKMGLCPPPLPVCLCPIKQLTSTGHRIGCAGT